ncbi:MAG: hypothetical protein OEW08_02135 [Gammaproteobacteria bacterium]|nr:hypothetical protein [Gammaproteobacteria bacterium]
MFELMDLQAKPIIKKRRQEFRLPFTAHDRLEISHATLMSTNISRSWLLPETQYRDEITHYYNKLINLGISGPRPILRTKLEKRTSEELAIKIDAALNFSALAENSDEIIKPILLYYSCVHLCGVYTRAFFDWKGDKLHHGLKCSYNKNVGETIIGVNEVGQFQRLASTCFLLTGQPNCFSDLVTYSQPPTAQTGAGELLEKFGFSEIGAPIKQLTLDELVHFNFGGELKKIRNRHGYHKFNGLSSTAFLIDIITLFVGSWLARYDVLGWKQVLEGKNNSYRIHFEDTFDRFQFFMIDALLARLDEPLSDFSKRLIPSIPSPYSLDDHTRFKNDPNYEQ